MVDLDDIRRTLIACRDVPWSCACITPQELEALVEEVERLRAVVADCEQSYRFAASKAEAKERAAVVAWLRDFGSGAWLENGGLSLVNLSDIADKFERGEHRREGET